jgi:hypothetical protein
MLMKPWQKVERGCLLFAVKCFEITARLFVVQRARSLGTVSIVMQQL